MGLLSRKHITHGKDVAGPTKTGVHCICWQLSRENWYWNINSRHKNGNHMRKIFLQLLHDEFAEDSSERCIAACVECENDCVECANDRTSLWKLHAVHYTVVLHNFHSPSIKKRLSTDCTMSTVSTPGKQTTKRDRISASSDDPRPASSAPCKEPNPASVNLDNKVLGK